MWSQQQGTKGSSGGAGGGSSGSYRGTGTKPDLDNHSSQGNTNNAEYRGYDRHFQGSQSDANNHGSQLNPNNQSYQAPKK